MAMPLSRLPWSKKTFRSSKRPSPSLSVRMIIRSQLVAFQSGYEKHSTTQSRPRSSKSKAIGCITLGSPAKSDTVKPSGRVMRRSASSGGNGLSLGSCVLTTPGGRPGRSEPKLRHATLIATSTRQKMRTSRRPTRATNLMAKRYIAERFRPEVVKLKFPALRSGREHRMRFFGIDAEIFHRLGDDFFSDQAFLRKSMEGPQHDHVGVDFEEPAQVLAGIAATIAVGSQCGETAGNPGSNLFRDNLHEIRNRDEDTLFVLQNGFEIGLSGRFRRVKHVPAADVEGIVAQTLVTGGAPDIGGDVVFVCENLLSFQGVLNDWPAAEDVGFVLFAFGAAFEFIKAI